MPIRSSANQLPRKVLIATTMVAFRGSAGERAEQAASVIEQAVSKSLISCGRGPDIIVLPEHCLQNDGVPSASTRAVAIDGPELAGMKRIARRLQVYLIVPAILAPRSDGSGFTNSAILIDRRGDISGIYDKVHPVLRPDNTLEGGITPGESFPVFECDFGRVGIQICWDLCYADGWERLAEHGAEIVALCSASPQTVRPAMHALRGGYFVVTSTPRNNASIFTPIGTLAAQTRDEPILIHQIDLAYAVVHWAAQLEEGRALTRRFGPRVGYTYSETEDTGVFWSNDPQTPVKNMITELGLAEMSEHVEASRQAAQRLRNRTQTTCNGNRTQYLYTSAFPNHLT